MGETAASASRVVRLGDYRRNAWSAADATWEQVTASAVASLGRGEHLQPALLLPRAEEVARLRLPADDPRLAASLTLLCRWQRGLGNHALANRLRAEAGQAWLAAEGWLDRLRPGADAAEQANCRRLLRLATGFADSLGRDQPFPVVALPAATPELLAGLSPDRRKLVAAAAFATARLGPGAAMAAVAGARTSR